MTTSRDQILSRIRTAIRTGASPPGQETDAARTAAAGVSPPGQKTAAQPGSGFAGQDTNAVVDAAYAALPRDYLRAHHDSAATDIVDLFAERAADYRAVVERVPASGLPAAIARALTARSQTVGAPDGPFGPSATSDIELIRVEGVHGPRTLHILLAAPNPASSPPPNPASSPRVALAAPPRRPGEQDRAHICRDGRRDHELASTRRITGPIRHICWVDPGSRVDPGYGEPPNPPPEPGSTLILGPVGLV